ncbi:MAG: pseudouridine synthase [Planctomycetota bacterium]
MAIRKKKTTSSRTRKKTNRKTTRKASTRKSSKSKATKKSGAGSRPRTATPALEPGELVRLNKYLADHGIASRRASDALIEAGKVVVDGEPVVELGTKVDPSSQVVEVDGVRLKPERLHRRYYLLNKPTGVVCTNERREMRPRAIDMITDPKAGRIYTIGRLDEDSSGLILLTNDGEYANRVMHPRYEVPKTYRVKLRGKIDDAELQKVRHGVHLAEGRTTGARIVVRRRTKDYSFLEVTLVEGMNREIRRAFARVGYKVVTLERTRIGPLHMAGIKRAGRWRELTLHEAHEVLEWAEERKAERDERGEMEALNTDPEKDDFEASRKGARKPAARRPASTRSTHKGKGHKPDPALAPGKKMRKKKKGTAAGRSTGRGTEAPKKLSKRKINAMKRGRR